MQSLRTKNQGGAAIAEVRVLWELVRSLCDQHYVFHTLDSVRVDPLRRITFRRMPFTCLIRNCAVVFIHLRQQREVKVESIK